MRIPITKPLFGDEERSAVQEPLETGWVVQGPHVETFEGKVADFVGADHAVATTSCTTALHLAVRLMDLEPGQEVLVPAFTWVATANVVEYEGATPVFVDVDLDTYNVDPDDLADAVTDDTVGILPVHLFGLPAEMDPILDLADDHDLWVVEDAACGLGARIDDRHVGTLGDAGCFSFHPRKSVTTGEGGVITTDDADLAETARHLRDHGADESDLERHEAEGGYQLARYNLLGYNYRMTDLQGAVGAVQMDRAEEILAARRRLAARYDDLLDDVDAVRTPAVPDGFTHGYQAYVCLFAPKEPTLDDVDTLHRDRNRVMAAMEAEGIQTRPGTHAAALQGYYRDKYDLGPEAFPNASIAEKLTLTLPLYPQMTDKDQDVVVEELKEAYHG